MARKALMDPEKFRGVLYSMADDLSEADLKSIKFLVSGEGDINIEQLENASKNDLVRILVERNMITSSDVSFLGELLREIGRHDLHQKVVDNFPDTQTCCRLSEEKAIMFYISRSMDEQDLRKVRFYLDLGSSDKNYGGVELMKLIETQTDGSIEKLADVMSKLGLSRLYNNALSERGMAKFRSRHVISRLETSNHVRTIGLLARSVLGLQRTHSFCDGTDCEEGCPYRQLWSEKFPRQLSPVFNSERLLNHDDVSTDGEDTSEELLGEGAFGKVYKGQ